MVLMKAMLVRIKEGEHKGKLARIVEANARKRLDGTTEVNWLLDGSWATHVEQEPFTALLRIWQFECVPEGTT